MTAKEILSDIIQNFDPESFKTFFRLKNTDFAPVSQSLNHYQDKEFTDFYQIGEINFREASQRLVVIAIKILIPLSERSGKKAQYEKAKKILKEFNIFDAGIFIFYDQNKNFRFSLIYANYLAKKRDWNSFRRFTYFVSREFTNNTFLQRIGDSDFLTLENIKEAFSVEPVNKEFYRNVARFFNELAGGEVQLGSRVEKHKRILILPSVAENAKTTYQEFTVRLIGRIIFCWFLKHKKSGNGASLISEDLLSSRTAKITSNYYHSILEKLFFEILRKPTEERRDRILEGSDNIPFLNGGLFEPHEEDFYEDKPAFNLVIPDKWFIEFFGMLEQYNFTIDENTAVDVDISVDPEMLGKIFENLLAEINPETGQTARKSTGSYYTPREIVDYMVDESLKQYLISKVNLSEEKVQCLLSYDIQEADFSDKQINAIIDALHEIKVLDPACGSGAFPIGVLHKMLLILQKIDPQSEKWFAKKIEKMEGAIFKQHMKDEFKSRNWDYVHKLGIIQNSIFGVDIQSVAVEISKLRFFLSLIVDEIVDDNAPNRGIKPLPSLEFKFVCANSLIGLPPRKNEQMFFNIEDEASITKLRKLRDEYFVSYGKKKKRIESEFLAIQKEMRQFYLKQISRKVQKNLFGQEIKAKDKEAPSVTKMLAQWNPFADEPCDWFDPEWMFGVRGGFDIVIANPPYVSATSLNVKQKADFKKIFNTAKGRIDTYGLFTEKAITLLNKDGCISYIVPNKFLTNLQFKLLRKFILETCFVIALAYPKETVFEAAAVNNIIFILQKRKMYKTNKIRILELDQNIRLEKCNIEQDIFKNDTNYTFLLSFSKKSFDIGNKIKSKSVKLSVICDVRDGIIAGRIKDKLFVDKPTNRDCKRLIFGDNMDRYKLLWSGKFVDYRPEVMKNEERKRVDSDKGLGLRLRVPSIFETPKIVTRKTADRIIATYDSEGYYFEQTLHGIIAKINFPKLQYVLGILNSKLYEYYYKNIIHQSDTIFPQVRIGYLKELPIYNVEQRNALEVELHDKIVSNVNRVLDLKRKSQNEDSEAKVKKYERQIDQMVYKLYGLTKEEVEIVENFNKT